MAPSSVVTITSSDDAYIQVGSRYSPDPGQNGTPSSVVTRASSDDVFFDAMDDDFLQVKSWSIYL